MVERFEPNWSSQDRSDLIWTRDIPYVEWYAQEIEKMANPVSKDGASPEFQTQFENQASETPQVAPQG